MKKLIIMLSCIASISLYATPPGEDIIAAQPKDKTEISTPSKLQILAAYVHQKFAKEAPDTLNGELTTESRVDNFITNVFISTGE